MEDGRDIPHNVLMRAVKCVLAGGVLLYPTDTVYGIGSDAADDHATKRIRGLKGSDEDKPLLVLTDSWARVQHWIAPPHGLALELMAIARAHPLTILFRATDAVPKALIGESHEIGIRLCRNLFCVQLIRASGRLITSTSANPSGLETPIQLDDVDVTLRDSVDLVVDGGILSGRPSTIVRPEGGKPNILREGSVSTEALSRLLFQRA